MDEWFKSHAWKACIGESLSGVRIPLSPPEIGLKTPQELGSAGFLFGGDYQSDYQNARRFNSPFPPENPVKLHRFLGARIPHARR